VKQDHINVVPVPEQQRQAAGVKSELSKQIDVWTRKANDIDISDVPLVGRPYSNQGYAPTQIT
jgi:hypothetical protein